MNIRQELDYLKKRVIQGADLLLLRLRLLNLDVSNQVAGIIRIFATIVITAVVSLIALIALLFGLNTVLPEQAKIWVFFGSAGLLFLIVLVLLFQIKKTWSEANRPLAETLKGMQGDLDYLLGRQRENPVNKQNKDV
ncbi:MAG: phage holin family protein [Neisseria sp.]|uniref:phage holin family protein n=1 Tax=Neisseria sp. TaxID=192066 RepID=UPI0026DB6043|nr:phage holin family protein [Neisseria sp.]MDO4248141.1 phage holin family protein [Neisseria sp.]